MFGVWTSGGQQGVAQANQQFIAGTAMGVSQTESQRAYPAAQNSGLVGALSRWTQFNQGVLYAELARSLATAEPSTAPLGPGGQPR